MLVWQFNSFRRAGIILLTIPLTFIGATTENPSFELNAALLSRARVLVFRALKPETIDQLLDRAEKEMGKVLPLSEEARAVLIRMSDGDGRAALTLAEEAWRAAGLGGGVSGGVFGDG